MKKYLILIATLLGAIAASAYDIPADSATDSLFQARKKAMADPSEYEKIEKEPMPDNEWAALKFLYAYMPLQDATARDARFYRENVQATLRALDEMPWGKDVPLREMLHFVLPLRVNNEALDMCRPAFYEELRLRVRNLSMEEAILEVNHWCHEKVSYRPSDGRTSSPLSTVSQAIGRCGEESTFAVAALRSVGIPARQVYTPRWAHTDDNHAWVETWANGKWHFIGACEPEPVLDLAWFNAPASRGILMSTNVFGSYDGAEEVLRDKALGPQINVTSNYAKVLKKKARVVDANGKPAAGAKVRFCVYNYAEFYPLCHRVADANGEASLQAGLGDMVIWASDGKNFGVTRFPAEDSECTVTLNRASGFNGTLDFDLAAPSGAPNIPSASDAQKAENAQRLAKEDSIRNAYISTFANDEDIARASAALDIDAERLGKILRDARGNHSNIVGALGRLDSHKREAALRLLEAVSEKDRRDIKDGIILSHVESFAPTDAYPLAMQFGYVLNPRIENEDLTPYKAFLADFFKERKAEFAGNPEGLARWIRQNISTEEKYCLPGVRMSPESVARQKRGDASSQKQLFVAAARSLGIPARIDPVRGEAQYADASGAWHDVLKAGEAPKGPSGHITLTYERSGHLADPGYYFHFTLSKIEDGMPRLLEYAEDATVADTFSKPLEIEAGDYVLTTGQRLANGNVLARCNFFSVAPSGSISIPLKIREDKSEVSVIGSLNAEDLYHDIAASASKSILSTTGRGYYILGLLRNGHEPSVHTLNDVSLLKDAFEKRKEKIVLLFDNEDSAHKAKEAFPNLPSNAAFGVDSNGAIAKEIRTSLNLESEELPIFVIADSFNRIVFVVQGYTIGLGDLLIKTLDKIEN